MMVVAGTTDAQSYATRQPTFPGGGGVVTTAPYDLYATFGEPAVSRITAGDFVLYSGFQASLDVAPRPPALFRDGFEPPPPPLPPAAPPLPP